MNKRLGLLTTLIIILPMLLWACSNQSATPPFIPTVSPTQVLPPNTNPSSTPVSTVGGPIAGSGSEPVLHAPNPWGLNMQPAKELPQNPPDVSGAFDLRQNNSIYVGTGEVTVSVQPDGSPRLLNSGPTVEVVVNSQTIVYKDVTMNQFNGPPPKGQQIQQVVEQGPLDEVGQLSMITVWGQKTSDIITAEVFVFTP